ncbi:MAG: hypothetical protein WD038_01485 [Balneolales bacterium]
MYKIYRDHKEELIYNLVQREQTNQTTWHHTNMTGYVHYVDGQFMIRSYKGYLYQSTDHGETWELIIDLSTLFSDQLKLFCRLTRRLFRTHIYHVIPVDDVWIVFGLGKIFTVSLSRREVIAVNPIQGSRPLLICDHHRSVYYGEYIRNPERRKISIFKSNNKHTSFSTIYSFNSIRHVHGVFHDPYSGNLFATTGDKDKECHIGFFKNGNFNPIISGSQQTRCVQPLFSQNHIHFATDAPDEKNSIYCYERSSNKITLLQHTGGPVFYSCQAGGLSFFATVCEPSDINKVHEVELWASADGNTWKCILTLKKDRWSLKYFGYGLISFPAGPGSDEYLWLNPMAITHDQEILKIPIQDIKKTLSK